MADHSRAGPGQGPEPEEPSSMQRQGSNIQKSRDRSISHMGTAREGGGTGYDGRKEGWEGAAERSCGNL